MVDDDYFVAMFKGVDVSEVPAAFGKIQTQFTGILAGIIGATCYNKFKSVKLPAGALAMYHCEKKNKKKSSIWIITCRINFGILYRCY